MPLPIPPVPAPQSDPLTGGTWVSGPGFEQSSGAPVVNAVYEQWLTIEYTRNPHYNTLDQASFVESRKLDQYSYTIVKNTNTTTLHLRITVHNSCKFELADYTLSSHYQPQKFSLLASPYDKVGDTYGDVSGPDNKYVFGPTGYLVTTQPYIRRRLKTSADVEYSLTQQGTNMALIASSTPYPHQNYATVTWGDGSQIWMPYLHYVSYTMEIPTGTMPYYWASTALNNKIGGGSVGTDGFGIGGGAYNTSSEPAFGDNTLGIQRMIQFIETNCAALAAPGFQHRYMVPLPTNSNGSPLVLEADRLAINPYYSTSVHEY